MKLSKKLLKALVDQVNMEFASGYLYRSMSHDMKTWHWTAMQNGWTNSMKKKENTPWNSLLTLKTETVPSTSFRLKASRNTTTIRWMSLKTLWLTKKLFPLPSAASLNLPVKKAIWKLKSSSSGTSPNRLKKKSTPATTSRDSKKHRKAPLSSTCSITTWATDNTLLKIE